MGKIIIQGGQTLSGNILISPSKNSILPIMASSPLFEQSLGIVNIPPITDVMVMRDIIENLGGNIDYLHDVMTISFPYNNDGVKQISPDLAVKIRSSILFIAPLVMRYGTALMAKPGGCAIGARPIDLHLHVLEKMGCKINDHKEHIEIIRTGTRLKGADITLHTQSVGATQTAIMAAVLASGTSIINNAAMEPEILQLGTFLNQSNAKISGLGSNTITIEGVQSLKSKAQYSVPGDRIEAITYIAATAATNGNVVLNNINTIDLGDTVLNALLGIGINLQQIDDNSIAVSLINGTLHPHDIVTGPFPQFATDAQPVLAPLLCVANGISSITENIFENRLRYASQLKLMGANITHISDNKIVINGVKQLHGAMDLEPLDLRASAGFVVAGLMAKGTSSFDSIYLDRGYGNICDKLSSCGAHIDIN